MQVPVRARRALVLIGPRGDPLAHAFNPMNSMTTPLMAALAGIVTPNFRSVLAIGF
jgi:hypothetical protein